MGVFCIDIEPKTAVKGLDAMGSSDLLVEAELVASIAEVMDTEVVADQPVEEFSVPRWYVDLYGGYTTISGDVEVWDESRTKYGRLGERDRQLYDEYAEILDKAFHEGLFMIGVSGESPEYMRHFVRDTENQYVVRKTMRDHLANNPRALELMAYFGIPLG